MARGDSPYNVVQKVGENAYKMELLGDKQISITINDEDLTPNLENDEKHDQILRENPIQGGKVDAEQTPRLDLSLIHI